MIKRLIWFWKTNRIGIDILSTHFLLYFKPTMRWLCKRKFGHFGEGSEIRPGVVIGETQNLFIGDNVIVRPGSYLLPDPDPQGSIIIEDDVLLGSCIHIYTDQHAFGSRSVPISEQGYGKIAPVRVRRGAWIGANVTILPGVTVGRNAVVGAGSVVTRDVPAFTVCVGNPARVIREIDEPRKGGK